MKIYYTLFISAVLCYILYRYFNETFNYENFDPSLVPVSSIIRLAKYTQQLVNGGDLSYVSNINIKSNNPTSLLVNKNLNISGIYNSVGSTIVNNPIVLKPSVKYSDTPGFTLNSPLDIQRSGLNFIDTINKNLEFNMFATRSDAISYSYYSESIYGNALKIYTSNPSDPTNTLKQLMSIDGLADGYGLVDRITINELKTSIINSVDNIIYLGTNKTESRQSRSGSNYEFFNPVYMNGNVQLSNSRKSSNTVWTSSPQNNMNGIYVIGDVVPNPDPLDTSVINLSHTLNALQINGEIKVPRLEVTSSIVMTKSDGKACYMSTADVSPNGSYCVNQFFITNYVGEPIFVCYPPDAATNPVNQKFLSPGIHIPRGKLNTNWDGGDNYKSGYVYSNNILNPYIFNISGNSVTLNLIYLNKCDNIILHWSGLYPATYVISGPNVVTLSSQYNSNWSKVKVWLKNGIDYNVGGISDSLTITNVASTRPFIGYIGI
jgi:hypothetical protein